MCGCKNNISGMKKKKGKSKGSFKKPLTMAVAGGAAMVGVSMATKQVKFMQDNPMVSGGIKLAGGVFLAMQKDDLAIGAGMGVAASGVYDLINHFVDNSGSGGGLLGKGDANSDTTKRQRGIQGNKNRMTPAQYARMKQMAAQQKAANQERQGQPAGAGGFSW